MNIKFVNGDILTFPERDGDTIICQQVNCRGVMGAGFAKQIRDKWPFVYNEYIRVTDVCDKLMLGSYQNVKVGPHLYVANLFGQDGYGRDKRYTNYAALTAALFRAMKERIRVLHFASPTGSVAVWQAVIGRLSWTSSKKSLILGMSMLRFGRCQKDKESACIIPTTNVSNR